MHVCLTVLGVLLAVGCTKKPAPAAVTVDISPATATLAPGATQQFSSSVTVAWSVDEANGGSINTGGLYTAPGAAGVFHVRATARADATKSAVAAVNVVAGAPTITSFTATPSVVHAGDAVTLAWAVTGATSLAIDRGVGAVTGTSVQVTPTVSTTYTLSATSSSATVTATVAVTVLSGAADVTISVDGTKQSAVSPYIYGVNFRSPTTWGTNIPSNLLTLDRLGGNRLTAWNWETNDSNCGNDCGTTFPNDAYLASSPNAPGGAMKVRADASYAAGLAFLTTVPAIGYVAADHAGAVTIPVAADTNTPANPGSRFFPMLAKNPAGPHASPDLNDGAVYADDFVAWAHATYPTQTLFYSLDNEPDLWGSTHAEIRGKTSTGAAVPPGFTELATKNASIAAAIKSVDPQALTFGPAMSGWFGFYVLSRSTTEWNAFKATGMQWYLDSYLAQMSAASATAGTRLLDVLDVHWYPEATNTCTAAETAAGCYSGRITNDWQRTTDGKAQWASVIDARVQSPRSLWDPSYVEKSWITTAGVPGGGGIALIPRLKKSIDTYFPGTKISVTEYYYGRGGDISGGVAQADVLGIFAREGVFAATMWPAANGYAWTPFGCNGGSGVSCLNMSYGCIWSAFKAFRSYDGQGGRFGDTLVAAKVSDDFRASAYASLTPGGAVLIVLNKSQAPLNVSVGLGGLPAFTKAKLWQVTGTFGSCTDPVAQPDEAVSGGSFTMALPALSITTVALSP